METAHHVGIDISKRSVSVCRLAEGQKPERISFKTDPEGMQRLVDWIKPNDLVALEAGNLAFFIARKLTPVCRQVLVLNPGRLLQIVQSMKKTDRADAHLLAWFIERIPVQELPTVEVPSEEQEDARRLASEHAFHTENRTSLINRLHAIFVHAGITGVEKEDVRKAEHRKEQIQHLPVKYQAEALRLDRAIGVEEEALVEISEEVRETLGKSEGLSTLYLSMPGIGLVTALTLLAYLGNGKRFSSAAQFSFYAGMVPKVDCSGDTNRYGHITKQGNRHLRRVMIQAAWALVRKKDGGPLQAKFIELAARRGKRVAIVAVARKMLECLFTMVRNGENYRPTSDEALQAKVKRYRLKLKTAA